MAVGLGALLADSPLPDEEKEDQVKIGLTLPKAFRDALDALAASRRQSRQWVMRSFLAWARGRTKVPPAEKEPVPVSLYVAKSLRAELEKEAAATGASLNEVVEHYLRWAYEDYLRELELAPKKSKK